jgi:PAS domain S-box-containing protein
MKRLILHPLSLPRQVVTVLALVLVAVIGVVDSVTEWDIHVTAFYLVPIAWVCWSAGRRAGLVLAVVATLTWSIAERISDYNYTHPSLLYWNALMLFVFFVVVVYLLSAFQTAHYHLQDTVQQRTAALQEREAMLRGLVEHAPDSIMVVDAQGRIVQANAQTEAMFGYRRDNLLGESVEMLVPERFRERHLGHRAGYGHEPQPRPMGAGLELYGRRKDGSEFPVDIMLSPMQLATGAMVIAIVRDITRRKRAEEQLRQSQQQLRALATRLQEIREEERTRIARELHDELGQAMTGLKMELAWVGKQLAKPGESLPTAISDKITEMTELINGTIHSVRRISSELRPGLLDDLGLAAAIEWQAHDFEGRSGIACDVTVPANGVDLNRETSTAVFRIFQETLTNVARHANATKVRVSMSQEGRHVILEIKDNGRGITASAISDKSSLGLLGMRERAALFGGEVNFVGVAGQGTTVAVTIPQPQTG